MGVFETVFTAGLTLAGSIVQVAVALLLLTLVYRVVWYIVSFVWQEIHKKSYDWVVNRIKSGFKQKKQKTEK